MQPLFVTFTHKSLAHEKWFFSIEDKVRTIPGLVIMVSADLSGFAILETVGICDSHLYLSVRFKCRIGFFPHCSFTHILVISPRNSQRVGIKSNIWQ